MSEVPRRFVVDRESSSDTLDTELMGVQLRRFVDTMLSDLVAAANHVEIPRYMSDQFPHPYTEQAGREWLEIAGKDDPPLHYGIFFGEELVGGLGGSAGQGEMTGTYEIGWWLTPQHWGKGITSAAAKALVNEFFGKRDVMRVWAPVMHPNIASRKVAMYAGLFPEGVSPSAYLKAGVRYDMHHFGLTRSQWQQQQ
ncbi:MAG: GNAT family N-acetyltransferase [Acidimicrobiia bacterium]|nr:GNAT family N-acetyltransferase [Acidimicrobiia bacterium]